MLGLGTISHTRHGPKEYPLDSCRGGLFWKRRIRAHWEKGTWVLAQRGQIHLFADLSGTSGIIFFFMYSCSQYEEHFCSGTYFAAKYIAS